MPNLAGIARFSSTFILAIDSLPWYAGLEHIGFKAGIGNVFDEVACHECHPLLNWPNPNHVGQENIGLIVTEINPQAGVGRDL